MATSLGVATVKLETPELIRARALELALEYVRTLEGQSTAEEVTKIATEFEKFLRDG